MSLSLWGCGGHKSSDGACGDGTLDTSAGEACDDGNAINGDGCNASCENETGPLAQTYSTYMTCYLGDPSDPGATLLGEVTVDATVDPVDDYTSGGSHEFLTWIEATIPESISDVVLQVQLTSGGDPATPILLDAAAMGYELWVGGASDGPVSEVGVTLVDQDPSDDYAANELIFGTYDSGTDSWTARPVVIETAPASVALTNNGPDSMAFSLVDFSATLTDVPLLGTLVLGVTDPNSIPPDAVVVCILEDPAPDPVRFYGDCFDGICGAGEDPSSCPADCPGTCGDNIVAGTEDCDDGTMTDSASCDNDCSFPACNDGILNGAAGEVCETGDTMDCTALDAAAWYSGTASCNASCDGYDTSSCIPTGCGNGFVDGAETCDGDGAGNGGETATCDINCTAVMCGDGTTNATAGETCDSNAVACSTVNASFYASSNATCAGTCDGWVTTGCHYCGDGNLDSGDGEFCDGPVDCSTVDAMYYAGHNATCSATCSALDTSLCPYCGNGSCDLADGENSGNCPGDCSASCGDAFCDTAGGETAANCPGDCPAVCGDLAVTHTEVCDGGSVNCSTLNASYYSTDTAVCNGSCNGYVTSTCSYCGDGIVDVADGEACEGAGTVACDTLGLGFTNGTATCSSCGWDTSGCTSTCTVEYDLNGTFILSNATSGNGPQGPLDATMAIEFTSDGSGNIVNGPVGVLFYWMHNTYNIAGVITDIHNFTPSCSGATTTPGGNPTTCPFVPATMTAPVATGMLSGTTIAWDACTATDYWSNSASGGSSYQPTDASSGAGCLNNFRTVGNINCTLGGFCALGGLSSGANPVDVTYNQPMVNGPIASGTNTLTISADRKTITPPTGNTSNSPPTGASWNTPNSQGGRSWSTFSTVQALPTGTGGTTCSGI